MPLKHLFVQPFDDGDGDGDEGKNDEPSSPEVSARYAELLTMLQDYVLDRLSGMGKLNPPADNVEAVAVRKQTLERVLTVILVARNQVEDARLAWRAIREALLGDAIHHWTQSLSIQEKYSGAVYSALELRNLIQFSSKLAREKREEGGSQFGNRPEQGSSDVTDQDDDDGEVRQEDGEVE